MTKGFGFYDGQKLFLLLIIPAFLCALLKILITPYTKRQWVFVTALLLLTALVYVVPAGKKKRCRAEPCISSIPIIRHTSPFSRRCSSSPGWKCVCLFLFRQLYRVGYRGNFSRGRTLCAVPAEILSVGKNCGESDTPGLCAVFVPAALYLCKAGCSAAISAVHHLFQGDVLHPQDHEHDKKNAFFPRLDITRK